MTSNSQQPAMTTQRAYTLRLRGVDPNDHSWRDALWATHEAVNKGAKVFGDWLLTLRGGLDHTLADDKVIEGAGAKQKTREPTDTERRDRRILLVLSWLSVEDTHGAPHDESLIVARGIDLADCRARQLGDALVSILKARGVVDSELGDPIKRPEDQPGTWLADCMPSLSAAIREDAAWVNRNKAFDAATHGWDEQSARSDAHTVLSHLFSNELLTLPTMKKAKKGEIDTDEHDEPEERRSAVKASSKGAGLRTRHTFSHLLGEGKPFGKPQRNLILRDQWHNYIKPKLEATGIPVLDARRKAKGKAKGSAPAHTELQREMFSKAASRVAQIVTKQRQQEADRLARKEADAELRQMEANPLFDAPLAALRAYCDEYRVTSGATGEFLIRPRQVTGWDRVIERWAAIKDSDPEAACETRIEAVKEAQDADEEKKFGDANLFFRLAEDRFAPIWRRDGRADPTILERFVKGMKARSDSERLKVAAFRHPDPHRSPIFCQFGDSRPPIRFGRLKVFTDHPGGNDPRAVGMLLWHPACNSAKLTLLHGISHRLDREIGSAYEQVQPNAEDPSAVSRRGRLGAAAAGLPNADTPARVAGVFDLKPIKSRSTNGEQDETSEENADNGKLKEPKWNGTLSADRRELVAIRKYIDQGDVQKANRRREQLRWTLTVSMEMEGRGPWFRYISDATDKAPFLRTVRKDEEKGVKRRKGTGFVVADGWPWQEFNKPLRENKDHTALVEDTKAARGEKACLILSRLPGLRVLSVDLGHRFAAACAVWEAISAKDMARACRDHGHREPEESDLFIHLTRTVKKERRKGRNKGKTEDVLESTIYRRIGADRLPDGSEHPAPWARLDRQFFIKLQGEERPVRAATNGKLKNGSATPTNEVAMVARMALGLGLTRDDPEDANNRGMDQLMRRAVRIATLGMKRHGRMAKIAYAFKPDCPGIAGMGGALKAITCGDDEHVTFLTNALADWHALATDTDWDGSAARKLWNEHIKPTPRGFEIGESTSLDADAERPTRQQRRKSEEELRRKLKPIAEHLAQAGPECTRKIHETWTKLWTDNDGIERTKDDFMHTLVRNENGNIIGSRTCPKPGKESPGGWHERLRVLTDWVMGWRLPSAESNCWNRNVGGLGLKRIATMRALYQLHKAFAMRPRPHDIQGAPEKGESNSGVAQSILDGMERMREQRVKQIASRIVEAGLGVGMERPRVWDETKKKWRNPKRPRGLLYYEDEQGVAHGDPRLKPCHAIVIENLRNYRPDELQTRRENRALMNWSAGKVRKYLEEACQLHGLHLREVMPNYTSRQDSRTGLPGVRCVDVPIDRTTGEPKAYWWNKALNAARDKKGDAESQFIVALADHLAKLRGNGEPLPWSVRVPRKGGDLFVAAPPDSCRADSHRPRLICDGKRALQADLNAAANIGLRALLDPDFPGKWWYVPCIADDAAGTAMPRADKVKGSACFGPEPAKPELFGSLAKPNLEQTQEENARRRTRGKTRNAASDAKETTNYWSEPDCSALRNGADGGCWRPTPAYWARVRKRVVEALWHSNGLAANYRLDEDHQS